MKKINKKIYKKRFVKEIIAKNGFIGRFKNATRILYTFKFQLSHELCNSKNPSIAQDSTKLP